MLQLDLAQGVGRSASDRIKRHARGGGTAGLVSEMDGRNAAAQGSKQLVIAKSGYAARGVLDPASVRARKAPAAIVSVAQR